ncbi:MAG: DUF3078 domain-containing protein [Armatimonadetes bacterium]|nr:DUF3078 domain-containing protein [Armatimonadota bacterium]
MNKIGIFISIFLLLSSFIQAEEWIKEGNISLSLNQNAYSDNWAGDENGSISWVFNADFLAEKQLNPKLHNKNTLKIAYGQTHSQSIDSNNEKVWEEPEKTTDLFDLESVLRFTLNTVVDPYISGRIESNFMDEGDEALGVNAKLYNPIIITEGFGAAKILLKKEKQELSTRLGGAFKQYVNTREEIDNTNDGGIEFIADYKTSLANEKIGFKSKLNIYKALYYSKSDLDVDDNWKASRMNWENIFTASITNLINVNLYLEFIYNKTDYDTQGECIDEIQFKQNLSLGLTYKFL